MLLEIDLLTLFLGDIDGVGSINPHTQATSRNPVPLGLVVSRISSSIKNINQLNLHMKQYKKDYPGIFLTPNEATYPHKIVLFFL